VTVANAQSCSLLSEWDKEIFVETPSCEGAMSRQIDYLQAGKVTHHSKGLLGRGNRSVLTIAIYENADVIPETQSIFGHETSWEQNAVIVPSKENTEVDDFVNG